MFSCTLSMLDIVAIINSFSEGCMYQKKILAFSFCLRRQQRQFVPVFECVEMDQRQLDSDPICFVWQCPCIFLRYLVAIAFATQSDFLTERRSLVEYLIIREQLSAFDIHCPLSIDDGQFHNFEPAWSGVYHGESHKVYWQAIFAFEGIWTDKVDT